MIRFLALKKYIEVPSSILPKTVLFFLNFSTSLEGDINILQFYHLDVYNFNMSSLVTSLGGSSLSFQDSDLGFLFVFNEGTRARGVARPKEQKIAINPVTNNNSKLLITLRTKNERTESRLEAELSQDPCHSHLGCRAM